MIDTDKKDMEELEQKIKQKIDEWGYETFFKGDDLNEDQLRERISWLYSSSMENMPEILILDSPLGCQLELHKLAETGLGKFLAYPMEPHAWYRVEVRMYDLAWTDIWCNSLPIFKTADNMTRLNAICHVIEHHIRSTVIGMKRRLYKFSEDNLFNRYVKIAFYDFISSAVPEERPGTRMAYISYIRNYIEFLKTGCFLSWFFKELAVISRRPKYIKFNDRNQLHHDGGAAIEWKDGWKQYYINGIEVSQEIVVATAESLDPELIFKERNAEIRREIVRKIGIDRILQKLGGKIIDSWNGYELITLDAPGMQIKPTYLKMKNPSIGTCHLEGVPPSMTTCKEALSWRVGGLKWNPKQLT